MSVSINSSFYLIAIRVSVYLDGIRNPQEFIHDRHRPIIGQSQHFLGAATELAIDDEIAGFDD